MNEPIFINDLEQLFFNDFIKCACGGDYGCLLISGEANDQQLSDAWLQLYSDYCRLSGSKEALKTVKVTAKMEILNTKIYQVTAIITALKSIPADLLQVVNYHKLTCLLKEWGYNKQYTIKSLANDLKRIEIELSNDQVRLKKMIHEKEDRSARKGDSAPANKETFVKALHAIEAHKKIVFPRATLCMYDFALYMNELQEHNNLNTQKTKRNGR